MPGAGQVCQLAGHPLHSATAAGFLPLPEKVRSCPPLLLQGLHKTPSGKRSWGRFQDSRALETCLEEG